MPNHIVSLTAENVKRLKAVHITPAGHMVVIGGNNGNGKSSVLDSIAMALGGLSEAAPVPVRRGEAKATIIADLGDITVKRTFTAGGGTSLTVSNKDGSKHASPQTILDKLTGKLAFDPLAFTHLDAKAQMAAIKQIVGVDFTKLEVERKTAYDQRTVANGQVKMAQQRVKNAEARPFHENVSLVSTSELLAELEKAKAHNAGKLGLMQEITRAQDYLGDVQKAKVSHQYRAAEIEDKIAELNLKLENARADIVKAKEQEAIWQGKVISAKTTCAAFVPVDEVPIAAKINGASAINQKVSENHATATELKTAKQEVDDRQKAADALSNKIEAIDAQKAATLAGAKFPVPGLSFDENGVTFNGLPFSQSSAAEQLRVSVAIAAALNPKLRVMLVRDGSLMDETSLALLGKLAAAHDLQVWVERVGKGDECSVIIEDGEVSGSGNAMVSGATAEVEDAL